MSKAEVTIVDIAQALGVSKTTVSSALHGSGRVSETTRAKVRAMAEAMGYVSNRAAQRLRGGQHHTVGLQIPSDVRDFAFYMEFAFGAAAVAADHEKDILLLYGPASERRHALAVDGLLTIDPTPDTFPVDVAEKHDFPIVTVGHYEGPGAAAVAGTVSADHNNLVKQVLDELVRRGASTPGLVATEGRSEPTWMLQIIDGYNEWCETRGIDAGVFRSPVAPSDAEIIAVLESSELHDSLVWMVQGPATRAEAIAARRGANTQMATMVLEAGSSHVLGIDLQARNYGRAAVELLLDVLAGTVSPGTNVVHEAKLVTPETERR